MRYSTKIYFTAVIKMQTNKYKEELAILKLIVKMLINKVACQDLQIF